MSDETSRIYRAWHDRSLGVDHTKVYNSILDLIPDTKDSRLIDLGCGTGQFIRESIKRGFEHVTGVDIASTAINIAQNYLEGEGITCNVGNETESSIVNLVQNDMRDTGLNSCYDHSTFLLPSSQSFDLNQTSSNQISLEIVTEKLNCSLDEAENWLADLKSANPEFYYMTLEKLSYQTFVRQTFREAYRILGTGGYFVFAEYTKFNQLIKEDCLFEEMTTINSGEKKEKIRGIIETIGPISLAEYPYSMASYEFIENQKVFQDIEWVSKLHPESMPLREKNPRVFEGVLVMVLQK